MDIAGLGNSIFNALKGDISAETAIRKERAALALTLATDPDASAQVSSATVNGQSFTTTQAMTNGQRLKLLSWVCHCFDNGRPISRTAVTVFNQPDANDN